MNKNYYKALGANIRDYRVLRGMTQEALAKKLGVTFQMLQKYEKGTCRIGPDLLTIAAYALTVRVAALLPVNTMVRAAEGELSKAFRVLGNMRQTPQGTVSGNKFIQLACDVATTAHAGQVRKYTGEPYVNHLSNVVATLLRYGFKPELHIDMFAAAWLHDVVEDSTRNLADILKEFGEGVAELVYWLTDYPTGGNRHSRALASAWRLSRAPIEAQLIKLADMMDNTESITTHDPEFSEVYLMEKARVLRLMGQFSPDIARHAIFKDLYAQLHEKILNN